MISVLVLAFRNAPGLDPSPGETVRTLSALVPAVVEGLVRDVALVAAPRNPDLTHVADHAGCVLVEADETGPALEAGARQCRCPDVLVLRAGVMIDRPFLDELSGILPVIMTAEQPIDYRLTSSETGWLGRVFPSMKRTAGVLITRTRLLASGATGIDQLARRSGSKLFRTRAWTGG